jgi:3-oxoadipate enol-lactonase
MPFVSLNGCELYYELHGPPVGSAPVVVFAHGAGGNHLSWWQQVPHFTPTHTCVTFDHRSFGRSLATDDRPAGPSFTDDLAGLLDHLQIPRATLVAQSMGGWTALGFALRFPDRVDRIVMADTHGGLHSDELATLWQAALVQMGSLPAGVHPAAGERMFREQPALHFLYAQIVALNPAASLNVGPWLVREGHTPLSRAAEVTVPVLVIAGEEDGVIPLPMLEIASRAFPTARLARVPLAGHSVYFERAAEFNRLVEAFLG